MQRLASQPLLLRGGGGLEEELASQPLLLQWNTINISSVINLIRGASASSASRERQAKAGRGRGPRAHTHMPSLCLFL